MKDSELATADSNPYVTQVRDYVKTHLACEAVVISAEFAGKSLIAQHRLVNAALGDRLQREEIHALGLRTFTPEAWATQQAQA